MANYALAAWLGRRPHIAVLTTAVSINVTMLAGFKALAVWNGVSPALQVLIPVGVSFWTFQAISHHFDIYRGDDTTPSFVEFALYLAFWPTVLAGPVCRVSEMVPQWRERPHEGLDDMVEGVRRIVLGLFLKDVASHLLEVGIWPGEGVAAGFARGAANWAGLDVWLLGLGFGLQLFFDFAGYSHIVIGSARLFGIRLRENFDRPYLSSTPAEFWTRWHKSLSSWIHDYVFFPLAAAVRATWWRYAALVLSMTLFGAWHGFRATFVLWGAYHGLLLVLHRAMARARRHMGKAVPDAAVTVIGFLLTLAAVMLGWVVFRAEGLPQALSMLAAAVTPWANAAPALPRGCYVVVGAAAAALFAAYTASALLERYEARPVMRGVRIGARWVFAVIEVIVVVSARISGEESLFAYFRF